MGALLAFASYNFKAMFAHVTELRGIRQVPATVRRL